MNISVILPVENPDHGVVIAAQALLLCGFARVIVVDDGSGTPAQPVLEAFHQTKGCVLLRHGCHWGRGAALKTGLNFYRRNAAGHCGVLLLDTNSRLAAADAMRLAQMIPTHTHGLLLGIAKTPSLNSREAALVLRRCAHLAVTDPLRGVRIIPNALFETLAYLPGDDFLFEINQLLAAQAQRIPLYQLTLEVSPEPQPAVYDRTRMLGLFGVQVPPELQRSAGERAAENSAKFNAAATCCAAEAADDIATTAADEQASAKAFAADNTLGASEAAIERNSTVAAQAETAPINPKAAATVRHLVERFAAASLPLPAPVLVSAPLQAEAVHATEEAAREKENAALAYEESLLSDEATALGGDDSALLRAQTVTGNEPSASAIDAPRASSPTEAAPLKDSLSQPMPETISEYSENAACKSAPSSATQGLADSAAAENALSAPASEAGFADCACDATPFSQPDNTSSHETSCASAAAEYSEPVAVFTTEEVATVGADSASQADLEAASGVNLAPGSAPEPKSKSKSADAAISEAALEAECKSPDTLVCEPALDAAAESSSASNIAFTSEAPSQPSLESAAEPVSQSDVQLIAARDETAATAPISTPISAATTKIAPIVTLDAQPVLHVEDDLSPAASATQPTTLSQNAAQNSAPSAVELTSSLPLAEACVQTSAEPISQSAEMPFSASSPAQVGAPVPENVVACAKEPGCAQPQSTPSAPDSFSSEQFYGDVASFSTQRALPADECSFSPAETSATAISTQSMAEASSAESDFSNAATPDEQPFAFAADHFSEDNTFGDNEFSFSALPPIPDELSGFASAPEEMTAASFENETALETGDFTESATPPRFDLDSFLHVALPDDLANLPDDLSTLSAAAEMAEPADKSDFLAFESDVTAAPSSEDNPSDEISDTFSDTLIIQPFSDSPLMEQAATSLPENSFDENLLTSSPAAIAPTPVETTSDASNFTTDVMENFVADCHSTISDEPIVPDLFAEDSRTNPSPISEELLPELDSFVPLFNSPEEFEAFTAASSGNEPFDAFETAFSSFAMPQDITDHVEGQSTGPASGTQATHFTSDSALLQSSPEDTKPFVSTPPIETAFAQNLLEPDDAAVTDAEPPEASTEIPGDSELVTAVTSQDSIATFVPCFSDTTETASELTDLFRLSPLEALSAEFSLDTNAEQFPASSFEEAAAETNSHEVELSPLDTVSLPQDATPLTPPVRTKILEPYSGIPHVKLGASSVPQETEVPSSFRQRHFKKPKHGWKNS